MLFNPVYNVRSWLEVGLFVGTLKSITKNGVGIIHGDSGPSRVYVPPTLLNGAQPGERFWYHATFLAKPRVTIAADLRRA